MSASAILSTATAAAPIAGRGTATTTQGAGDDFEAILATEAAILVAAAPPAVLVRPAPVEGQSGDPSIDVGDTDTPTPQNSDPAPVWTAVTPLTLPPTLLTTDSGNVAGTDSEASTVAIRPVDGSQVVTNAETIDLVVPQVASGADVIADPVAPSATAPLAQTTPPDGVGQTPHSDVTAASTTGSASQAGVTAPQTNPAPAPHGDLAKGGTEPTASSGIPPVPVAVQTPRSAANASLADAALVSLRQLPGASTGALQQAGVSQRKASIPAVTSTNGAIPSVATPTLLSDAADPVASVWALTPIAVGAAEVRDAAAASSAPTVEARLAAVSAAGPVSVANPETLPSIQPDSATDGAFDLAKPGKAVDLLPHALEPLVETPAEPDAPVAANPSASPSASTVVSPGLANASLSSLSRATIETTASLAAQITSRLAGKSTRFELGLTPEGLGRVDVTLDIDADGQLSARLAFDNPLAATELRGRADELRRQLEDAGFTLARDALDFSSRDNPSSGERRQQRATAYADRHAANDDLIDIAPPAWTPSPSRLTPQGVDVKV